MAGYLHHGIIFSKQMCQRRQEMIMKIAMLGLGKMGANMARRLRSKGHVVVGYNRSPGITEQLAGETGLIPAFSVAEAVGKLEPTRIVWLMVPAGDTTETMIQQVINLLSPGDVIIDGGNSNFNDTIRRAEIIEKAGIHFVDVGTSGGIWGLSQGYSLMVGGEEQVVNGLKPIFESLAPAPDRGWGYVGAHGTGHYVKMVHNGIEYALMEAYAEGFELLRSRRDFNLDLHQIAEVWRYGSVVRSWLLDLTAAALEEDSNLSGLRGYVADSGEGRWTIFEAIDQDVPVPVIAISLFRRFDSRQDENYAAKLLAAMRNQFGGHEVHKANE
jgi:6-phosphogluconate dehydrogenase